VKTIPMSELVHAVSTGTPDVRYMVETKHGALWTFSRGDRVEFYGSGGTGDFRNQELADAIRERCFMAPEIPGTPSDAPTA